MNESSQQQLEHALQIGQALEREAHVCLFWLPFGDKGEGLEEEEEGGCVFASW